MRIQKALKNSFFSLLGQIVLILIGFVSQRVMNLRLGAELVGMNGVISNIIAMLSVTELGVASAIVYHLYGALEREDENQVATLMNFYRKAYYVFAAVITGLGLVMLPFVPIFLKSSPFSLAYIRMIYLLWLVRTVLSYLLSYRRSILIADQREYVVSIVTLLVNVVNYTGIIFIVEFTKRYEIALTLNIIVEAASNLWLSRYVNKKYPYLVRMRKSPLQKGIVKKVVHNIKDIFITRLASKLLVSTDNLIISGFISVWTVGLYNNYCLVTQSLQNIVLAVSNAIQPSVGHMFIEEDQEKNCQVLRQITFLFFVIASVACAAVFSLITPFVGDFWLNTNYVMGLPVVAVCVANFCIFTVSMPIQMMMGVTGLFDQERNISMIVALVNLALSLALVKPLGIIGVLIGTFVSYFVQMAYRVFIFFRTYVKRSSRSYVLDMIQYFLLSVGETAVVYLATSAVYKKGSLLSFLLIILMAAGIPLCINVLLFFRTWRFQSILGLARMLLKKEPQVRA